MWILKVALFCLLSYEIVSQTVDPTVELSTGLIKGRTVNTHYDEDTTNYKQRVNTFYGIPYGQAPVGNLRFEKPLPAEPWEGVRNASSLDGLPTACMQSPGGVLRYTHPLFDNIGEDCLNLNVFAPFDMSPTAPYPVMVYFYGGAFNSGANIQYPGHFYAARDVIAITVNYRLGIFGFFNTYPLDTSVEEPYGNAGLYDQALALEWVQENIVQFGGDPGRVTIFGQSAGAASSGLHTVSPVSKDLFHGVIEQSGCDTNFWSVNLPAQTPWEYPKQVAEKVNCQTTHAPDMIDCLRSIDPEELRGNQSFSCTCISCKFGGDPGRVTIFGQSAGAASSGLHTVSPVSKDLFHGVIEQSGCDTNFWSVNLPAQTPWEYPKQVAEKVNCQTTHAPDMIDCLRSIDPEELRGNQSFSCTAGHFCLGHSPVIDGVNGEGGFLPKHPLDIRAEGNHNQVPIFGGFNAEDGSLYVLAYIPEAMEGGFNRTEFQTMLYERLLIIWKDSLTEKQTQDAYWATDFFYTPWPYIEDEGLNRKAFVDMVTDAPFGFPVDRQLKLNSEEENSYMFVFGYRSRNASSGIFEDTEWAGVPHSGEIPYTFGWALLPLATEVRRDARMFIDIVPWNEEDFAYADFTMDLFSNFAKYHNPTPEPVEAPIGHGPITIPPLTQDELNYIWIHLDDVEARVNYRQREYAFFREYMSYIVDRRLYDGKTSVYKGDGKGMDTEIIQKAYDNMFQFFISDEELSAFENDYEDYY